MKLKLTILFLAVASIAMAQKKEMRKIEKAIDKGDFIEAQTIFNSIDENTVEAKYVADYNLYKAASLMDLTGSKKTNLKDLRTAEATLKKAKGLGFEDTKTETLVQNLILARKYDLANEKISKDPATALMLIEELYDFDKSNLDMLYDAGNIAYNNKMFDKAIEKYSILLGKNYTGVKTTFLATNKEGVVEDFPSKTLRDFSVKGNTHVNPTSETSPSRLGDVVLKLVWLYKNNGDAEKAKSIYEKAKMDHPEDVSLELVKADIFLTLKMMDEYKEALESTGADIKDPKVYDNLGAEAMKIKNYASAIRYFESSLKLDPDNYFALVNLSNANLEQGNLKETSAEEQKVFYTNAVGYLEKAHKAKPEEKGIVATLISLYEFLGMSDKAAEMKTKM
jgi:tetratricopeptide (TPR) repeat protein